MVRVPFTDRSGSKRRPALVVSTRRFHAKLRDVIICPISSQPRYHERPGPGDRPLRQWAAAGLRHPSTVRVSNILAIEKALVARTLGSLAARDLETVEATLREALGI